MPSNTISAAYGRATENYGVGLSIQAWLEQQGIDLKTKLQPSSNIFFFLSQCCYTVINPEIRTLFPLSQKSQ